MGRNAVTPDRVRFERLYERHSDAVARYCLRRTRSGALADDACSETFLVAWRRLRDVPDEPLPWLLAVARRVVGNLLRGDARREALKARLHTAQTQWAVTGEQHDDPSLDAALAELSEPDREALMLVYWDGLGTADAAAAMNTTPGALRVRLYRARRELARRLRADRSAVDLRLAVPSKELP